MDFAVPADLQAYLDELDAFIEAEIRPLERADDNIRFFDHRREHSRTDWDNQGLPRHEWSSFCARRRGWPMPRATGVFPRRRNMAARMAAICGWR